MKISFPNFHSSYFTLISFCLWMFVLYIMPVLWMFSTLSLLFLFRFLRILTTCIGWSVLPFCSVTQRDVTCQIFYSFIHSCITSYQIKLKTEPADFHFPTMNQTRHCLHTLYQVSRKWNVLIFDSLSDCFMCHYIYSSAPAYNIFLFLNSKKN